MLPRTNGVFRLTRDIEMRYTQGGTAIANVGLAASEKYKTQSGEQKEEVIFIDAVAFSRLGEIMNQYLRKGSKVYLIGKLRLEQWTTNDGQKRSKHVLTIEHMEMLDQKPQNDAQQPYQQPNGQQPMGQGGYPNQAPQATPQNNLDDPNRHNINPANRPPLHQDPYYQQQQGQPQQGQQQIPVVNVDEEIPFAPIGMSEGGHYVHCI